MPSKKISQLDSATSSQIFPDDLLTIVDVSETDITKINKKTTFEELGTYLKSYSNIFPVPLTPEYILTDASVNGEFLPIDSKVANKTVNVSDIGSLKFDQYGRVYDFVENNKLAFSEQILMGAGSAASYYKTRITSDFDIPQPVNATRPSTTPFLAYFNQYSYWNAKDYSGTIYSNSSKINYSDRTENDFDWTYLFNKKYKNVNHTSMEINYSILKNENSEQQLSKFNLDIFWNTGKVIGTGIFSDDRNIGYSFVFNGTLNKSGASQQFLPSNFMDTNGIGIVRPALYITSSNDSNTIDGLPIPCWKDTESRPINQPVNITVTIRTV